MSAKLSKQIHLTADDRVGALAELLEQVQQAGVNILAMCAWAQDGQGHLMMVTDDNDKACAVVRPHVTECKFDEVVCLALPNLPGALKEVARKIADAGVAIEVLYATACDCEKCECDTATVIIGTTNNAKVVEVLGR